jgi:hypothetical protein
MTVGAQRRHFGFQLGNRWVSRMRNLRRNREVPLRTYQQLQQPRAADHGVLQRILTGLTCRE